MVLARDALLRRCCWSCALLYPFRPDKPAIPIVLSGPALRRAPAKPPNAADSKPCPSGVFANSEKSSSKPITCLHGTFDGAPYVAARPEQVLGQSFAGSARQAAAVQLIRSDLDKSATVAHETVVS